jgi:hypothetical protein
MVYVPYLNRLEGMSLTPKQWSDIGIHTFAVDIIPLLQRPGMAKHFFSLADVKILVDLRAIDIAEQKFSYRLPDGRIQHILIDELLTWIHDLEPEQVIYQDADLGEYEISHLPAIDAFAGRFYALGESLNILDSNFEQDFNPLSSHCNCETCEQGSTRAYLHHLYQHTPLLAQRYLLIHNVSQSR